MVTYVYHAVRVRDYFPAVRIHFTYFWSKSMPRFYFVSRQPSLFAPSSCY